MSISILFCIFEEGDMSPENTSPYVSDASPDQHQQHQQQQSYDLPSMTAMNMTVNSSYSPSSVSYVSGSASPVIHSSLNGSDFNNFPVNYYGNPQQQQHYNVYHSNGIQQQQHSPGIPGNGQMSS